MNEQQLLCPQCEKGHLHADEWEDDFRHGEETVHVTGLERYRCDKCDADPVFADQIRRNQLRIADAKRRADGMLQSEDIRLLREVLKLTQQEAAAIFGGGANAFSKYERGDVIQSDSMDRLLKLTRRIPALLPILRELAGLPAAHANLDANYGNAVQICVNDVDYRSRTVKGSAVVVDIAEWKIERRAA